MTGSSDEPGRSPTSVSGLTPPPLPDGLVPRPRSDRRVARSSSAPRWTPASHAPDFDEDTVVEDLPWSLRADPDDARADRADRVWGPSRPEDLDEPVFEDLAEVIARMSR